MQPGTLVQMRCGGPLMVVSVIANEEKVWVYYHNPVTGLFVQELFSKVVLRLAHNAPVAPDGVREMRVTPTQQR